MDRWSKAAPALVALALIFGAIAALAHALPALDAGLGDADSGAAGALVLLFQLA